MHALAWKGRSEMKYLAPFQILILLRPYLIMMAAFWTTLQMPQNVNGSPWSGITYLTHRTL